MCPPPFRVLISHFTRRFYLFVILSLTHSPPLSLSPSLTHTLSLLFPSLHTALVPSLSLSFGSLPPPLLLSFPSLHRDCCLIPFHQSHTHSSSAHTFTITHNYTHIHTSASLLNLEENPIRSFLQSHPPEFAHKLYSFHSFSAPSPPAFTFAGFSTYAQSHDHAGLRPRRC